MKVNAISEVAYDDLLEMAIMNEPIPYEALLVAELDKVTKEDLEWAKSVVNKEKPV